MSAGGSLDEGHSQLRGWDGSWIWVQLVTFLGCSFCFPARSAQRWRRWQLHGSAVPVAAVRPREELPQPGASGCSLALNPLCRAAPHPSTARGQEPAPLFLWLLLFLWLPGSTRGPVAVPACPFPLQPKRPRCHRCSSVRVLPRVPPPSSGASAGAGRAQGAQSLPPQAVQQGKLGFPSKGCSPDRAGGVRAPGCPWGDGWVPPRLSEQQFLPGQHPVGAVIPLSPLFLCRWFGASNPSLCSPRSCSMAGERLVQQHHHVQLVTRSVHLTP